MVGMRASPGIRSRLLLVLGAALLPVLGGSAWLLRAGDAVLVDDPGYPNLMFMLRHLGARLVGVPRTPQGYDVAALEALIVEHRPGVFFTQPRLQSPTNSVTPVAQTTDAIPSGPSRGVL